MFLDILILAKICCFSGHVLSALQTFISRIYTNPPKKASWQSKFMHIRVTNFNNHLTYLMGLSGWLSKSSCAFIQLDVSAIPLTCFKITKQGHVHIYNYTCTSLTWWAFERKDCCFLKFFYLYINVLSRIFLEFLWKTCLQTLIFGKAVVVLSGSSTMAFY